MKKFRTSNLTFKTLQRIRIFGGIGLSAIGTYLICEYYKHFGWKECQKFVHDCYPDEYDAITKKVTEFVIEHKK